MCGLADNRTTKYNKEMRKNRIRILSMVVFSLCLPFSLFAQIDKDMKEFDDFVKQQHKEFDDFVSEQNKEFAEFLKETWKEYDLQKPVAFQAVRSSSVRCIVLSSAWPAKSLCAATRTPFTVLMLFIIIYCLL